MAIDLKKDRKEFYQPPRDEFVEVTLPAMTYLACDGHGDPNTSEEYTRAVESLYAVAYCIRAELKRRTGSVFVVGPLEGLWTSDDPSAFADRRKSEWDWTMLMPLPEQVADADVVAGREAAARKKRALPIDRVRIAVLKEGRCLQILHVGSYDDEAPVLARLHAEVMPARGLTWNGPHHEIYLGDPRKTDASKLRTVLRQPVRASHS